MSSKGAVEGSLPWRLGPRTPPAGPDSALVVEPHPDNKKPFDILNNHIDEQPNRNRLGGLFRGSPFFFISSKFPFFFLFFLAFPPPLPPLSLAFQDWFSFPINFIFDPQEEKTSK